MDKYSLVYVRRMTALQDKEESGSHYKGTSRQSAVSNASYKNMSPGERDIAERLAKLREKPASEGWFCIL